MTKETVITLDDVLISEEIDLEKSEDDEDDGENIFFDHLENDSDEDEEPEVTDEEDEDIGEDESVEDIGEDEYEDEDQYDDEDDLTDYNDYRVGYFKIDSIRPPLDDTPTNVNEVPMVRVMEEMQSDFGFDSGYDFENLDVPEEDDDEDDEDDEDECFYHDQMECVMNDKEDDEVGEDVSFVSDIFDSEMLEDDAFKFAQVVNDKLDETINATFHEVTNLYFARDVLIDQLSKFGLEIPSFDFPPEYDEWLFDIETTTNNVVSDSFICHVEVLKNDDDTYSFFAGVVPA